MKFQTKLAFLLSAMVASFLFASSASAQPCSATACPLGPESNGRSQIGNGLPLPITFAPGQTGFVTNANGLVAPVPGVSVMQGPGVAGGPRTLTFPPGQFKHPGPLVKLPVFNFNPAVFQVNTALIISNPRVGSPSPTAMEDGRTGPATVTWCPGNALPTGTPLVGFNPGCPTGNGGAGTLFNGLARYTATANQFGGPTNGRTTGANDGPVCTANSCDVNGARAVGTANATVYQNVDSLAGVALPCNGAGCNVAISVPVPITDGVFGGAFGEQVINPQGLQLNAVRTANIGANGTIISIGALVPAGGPFSNGAFPQQGVTSFGLPGTTGMLTISVTGQAGIVPEVFVRTGNDSRDAGGNGIVNIVGGALSDRTFSGPNANRTWTTFYLPEPGALVAGASALMMLGGAHLLVRRRR